MKIGYARVEYVLYILAKISFVASDVIPCMNIATYE